MKDPQLAYVIIAALLRYWPATITSKQALAFKRRRMVCRGILWLFLKFYFLDISCGWFPFGFPQKRPNTSTLRNLWHRK